MLSCLISLIIYAIIALIILIIIETILAQFFPLPPKILLLIRVLVGLLLLIQALSCLGLLPLSAPFRN